MKLEGEQSLLRVHVGNRERWHTQPLYVALVERARREHLAGATVLAAMAGYPAGRDPEAHPMVLEFVDTGDRLEAFLGGIAPMLEGHAVLVTVERAHVVRYRGGGGHR